MSNALKVYIPGERICKVEDSNMAGKGTYVRNGYIYSSLAGLLMPSQMDNDKELIEVKRDINENTVPSVGSLVLVKVTLSSSKRDGWIKKELALDIKSVNPRFCKCDIIGVEKTMLREPFRGIIRKEDVRATEKDKVELSKCYRPSDIVLAKVVSLGDAHSYVLTTAENELGVVLATSEADETMVPISWQEMQCPKTFVKEYRKVAKVQQQYIQHAT